MDNDYDRIIIKRNIEYRDKYNKNSSRTIPFKLLLFMKSTFLAAFRDVCKKCDVYSFNEIRD